MKSNLQVGFWLPPRKDLTKTITLEEPAHLDYRIYDMMVQFLRDREIPLLENADFRKARIQNDEVWLGESCISQLDHLIWMGMLDRGRDSYHLEVLRNLNFHVQTHNSFSFYSTITDKYLAFSELHRHAMPVSEIHLVNTGNYSELESFFGKQSFLLKPRRSSFGQGIVKIDSFAQLRDTLEYHQQKDYYLEKFYPNDLKDWTGVTVINGEVLYGFRKNEKLVADWKVYDKAGVGGDIVYVKPDSEIETLSKKAGEILGGNYYGLDFIKTSEGYKIVDINASPGIYFDLISEMRIPIAELFLSSIPELKISIPL